MRQLLTVLGLLAFLNAAASAWQDSAPTAKPVSAPTIEKAAEPMAKFACLIDGTWRVTAASGTSMLHTWHWGPGKHSIRRMTEGQSGAGDPWRELQALYWHPARKEVRLFGLSPFAKGVAEGAIQFDGKTAQAKFDLFQTAGQRKMGLRWKFEGSDQYHEELLEATGSADLAPLAEWDYIRTKMPNAIRAVKATSNPTKLLKLLESLLNSKWQVKGIEGAKGIFPSQATIEWIPLIDAFYARLLEPAQNNQPSRLLLDAYLYHHTGTGALRCLALSHLGAVYEGDVKLVDDDALQLELQGYQGEQAAPYSVRLDFAKTGKPRFRAWNIVRTERTLLHDLAFERD